MDSAKEKKAIERLKAFEPADGYYLAYSGGKDSDCIKILAQLSGVKFEAVHNLTTVDAPETVRYVQSQPDVKIDKAYDKNGNHVTMWNLIVKKLMPPTRLARYCYSELKERGGIGRVVVTGVRWSESQRRKETSDVIKIIGKPKATMKAADEIGIEYQQTYQGGIILNDDNDKNRRLVEHCYRTTKTMVNPIVDWSDYDVWAFLHYYGCKSNPLYECGFNRIGCIANGEWVQGYPCRYGWIGKEKDYIIPDYASALYTAEIDPETVGQYTGLTDTNGNKIFEGDIVVSDYIDYEDERGVIQWDSDIAKFIITFSTFTIDFDNVYGRELEIVGNVYDNPELLEAGEMP